MPHIAVKVNTLIRVLNNENHVVHPLLPNRNEHRYELRRRRHECTLTSTDDKRNFVYRQLHKLYELYFTNKVAIKLKENNTKIEHRHTHTHARA